MTTEYFVSKQTAWGAVLRRDRHYDGRFVYAAVTTGIYCRPSCPARSPRRRNTLLFRTATDAEERGYAACLRCHPRALLTPAEAGIKVALHYIDAHSDQIITLKILSQLAGVSPHHFRETFQRTVGLSPKSFCDARRIAAFKQLVRSEQTISGACYQAGFGSSRALYEKARHGLGMTPAAYQCGGRGMHIRFGICASPSGLVLIARARQGVCAVILGQKKSILVDELKKEFPYARCQQKVSLQRAQAKIIRGLRADPFLGKLPASLRDRIFQAKLLDFLK